MADFSTGWLAVAALASASLAADHPLVKPYAGSTGGIQSVREFDEYELPVGPLTAQGGPFAKTLKLEGKVTVLQYSSPAGRSGLEVFRNYEAGLKQGGFTILFTCRSVECAVGQRAMSRNVRDLGSFMAVPSYADMRYLAARLERPEGDVYVAFNMPDPRFVYINIVEGKPMQTGKVQVNAAALSGDIGRLGHAAVYDIHFDTGKAEIRPESEPALGEIGKLLKENPALKLHVIGHTDNVGALASNMDLSRRRAAAVTQVLTAKFGVAAARLNSDGVGPLSPVASNRTDEGRAKNRRVELVEQ